MVRVRVMVRILFTDGVSFRVMVRKRVTDGVRVRFRGSG